MNYMICDLWINKSIFGEKNCTEKVTLKVLLKKKKNIYIYIYVYMQLMSS